MTAKIIQILIAYLTIASVYCQSSDHFVFKGVPIDGTLAEYVSKMKEEGFTNLGTEEGRAVMSGDFAGYKDCTIEVSVLKQKDLVYKIGVMFPEKETWSTLSMNYFDLRDLLIEKYGKPSDVIEKFDGSQPSDDSARMYKVKFDNCKYKSIWQTEKGEIQLSIEHEGMRRCYVRMIYFDKRNSSIIRSKAKHDL